MVEINVSGSTNFSVPIHEPTFLDVINDSIVSLFRNIPYLNEFIEKLKTPYPIQGNHPFTINWFGGIVFLILFVVMYIILRKSNLPPLNNRAVAILISFFVSATIIFKVI